METIILHKETKKGKVRFWEIETDGAEVISSYGVLDTENPKSTEYTAVGKNIGHINETTPEEQAEKEAVSKARTKIKAGYEVVEGQDNLDDYEDKVAERKAVIEKAKAEKKAKKSEKDEEVA